MSPKPTSVRVGREEPPLHLQLDTHKRLLLMAGAGTAFALLAVLFAIGALLGKLERQQERANKPVATPIRVIPSAPPAVATAPAIVEVGLE